MIYDLLKKLVINTLVLGALFLVIGQLIAMTKLDS